VTLLTGLSICDIFFAMRTSNCTAQSATHLI